MMALFIVLLIVGAAFFVLSFGEWEGADKTRPVTSRSPASDGGASAPKQERVDGIVARAPSVEVLTPDQAAPARMEENPLRDQAVQLLKGMGVGSAEKDLADQENRNVVSGWLAKTKAVTAAENTREMQSARNEIVVAGAKQANELMNEAVEFGRKTQDLELLPLEKEEKESAKRASIAKNNLEEVRAITEANALLNPPAAPPSAAMTPVLPHEKPAPNAVEEMKIRIKSVLEKTGPVVRSQVMKEFEAEAKQRFKGDPQAVAAYMQAVEKELAKEQLK